DGAQTGPGITEEQATVGAIEEEVHFTTIAGGHAPLEHDHLLGRVSPDDGHAMDRRGGVALGGRVHHVVGADHQHGIVAVHDVVHVLHGDDLIVVDIGLGQQYVHVAGHAARHGVDDVMYRGPHPLEHHLHLLAHALGLAHGHAIAG